MAEQDQQEPKSIREMAEGGETAEELFPAGSLDGDGVTLKTLVKPWHHVKTTVSMGRAEVPIRDGGLLDPDKEVLILVTCEVGKLESVPEREGDRGDDRRLVGWKERQNLRPIYCERVQGEEGTIEAAFADLMAADPSRAGALLDRLKVRASEAMAAA